MNTQPYDQPLPGLHLPPSTAPSPAVVARDEAACRDKAEPTLVPTARDIARFNNKIVRSPSCWFWTGAISTPDGYGRFTITHRGMSRTILAHRFALIAAGIRLDDATIAEHACNEPLCVRVDPHHVHPSTQQANLAYAVRTGRLNGNHPTVNSHNRAARSLKIRNALAHGWNTTAFHRAIMTTDETQPPLF